MAMIATFARITFVLGLPGTAVGPTRSMSNLNPPPEEDAPGELPTRNAAQRGYFFYVAGFFILVGLLCYILANSNISWTLPAPVTSTITK